MSLPDGMKAACCWNCMLARACWYGNTPALNIVVAPLAFSSAGLFGKGGKTGGSPWWGVNIKMKEWERIKGWQQWEKKKKSFIKKCCTSKQLLQTQASEQCYSTSVRKWLDSGDGTLLVTTFFSRILQTLILNNTVYEIIILQARTQLDVSVKK